MSKRFALLASTGASVVKSVYAHTERAEFCLDLVLTDRICGAEDFAILSGIPCVRVSGDNAESRSTAILNALNAHKIDYVYVFYSRLLVGDLLREYEGRLINFHPSLLPACPGLHGFEDSLASRSTIIGTTVHLIDQGTDTGCPLLQGIITVNPYAIDPMAIRHEIFAQQCASVFQVHQWLCAGGIRRLENNRYVFENGDYSKTESTNPALEQRSRLLFQRILG